MISAKDFGMAEAGFKRLCAFYLAIQLAIWAKVAAFYLLIGEGATAGYTSFFGLLFLPGGLATLQEIAASSPYAAFDIVFHNAAHVLIAACVFVLAKNSRKLELSSLMPLFIAAAVLHNAAYWAAGVVPFPLEAYPDFTYDVLLLFVFAYAFAEACGRVPALRRLRVPVIEPDA